MFFYTNIKIAYAEGNVKQYLTILDHSRVNSFKIMKIERFEMEWHTKNNDVACVLFLMRHMEVYRGGGVEKINVDLVFKCNSQKILLSNLNLCKSSFVTTVEDYDKLTCYKRKKIYS